MKHSMGMQRVCPTFSLVNKGAFVHCIQQTEKSDSFSKQFSKTQEAREMLFSKSTGLR